jgi:hypothetical protein
MVVFLTKTETGGVHVQARLQGEGGTIGDMSHEVRPGESFFGWSAEELKALGQGRQELSPKTAAAG